MSKTAKMTSPRPELRRTKHAAAYYGVLSESRHALPHTNRLDPRDAYLGEISPRIEQIIESHKIRDWVRNADVQNQMKADIEDYLFDEIQPQFGMQIDTAMLDEILDRLIELARRRDPL